MDQSVVLTVEEEKPTCAPSRARIAVSAMFLINGGAVATWASRIPTIQEKLGLSTGPLGIALLSMAIGALLAMSLAGALANRIGSRPVVTWCMCFTCLSLIFPAFAPNLLLLSLSVCVIGFFAGAMDVAMNAHAVAVQRVYHRPIMSFFHALFSMGCIGGACFGALLANFNISPELHFPISAVVLLTTGLTCRRWLLPASADATGAKIDRSLHIESVKLLLASPLLMVLSILMFCCFMVEGAMGDWSGVFLKQSLHTTPGFAALGFASFSIAMTIGRVLGDRVNQMCGAITLVRGGSLIALLGLALVILGANPILALIGFAFIGVGASNIVPICFTAAGSAPNMEPGPAIATVALVGYFGLLAGPPIIGFVAERVTLPVALAMLVALLLIMILLAPWVNHTDIVRD